ncbi:TIR domain-containing protein [Streptomyces sp. WM6372]|uniref:TIR domain-containing protein n=1 Tax=Streptomyces sp. WM6372 TaxID=1415555 RepID=UPI00099DA68B|nr:TIR domain-containing protein [Streptomyces sp. WM6372]
MPNTKRVFVVHGRDHQMRDELIGFLKGLGLHCLTWGQARALAVGNHTIGDPTIEQIIDAGMEECQVIVVLMTPDEWVTLKPAFAESVEEESRFEQSRPNVIYEAGLARGKYPDRTIIVEAGASRTFTDLAGVHRINLRQNSGKGDLKLSLERLCEINAISDWANRGDFSERFKECYRRWQESGHRRSYLLDANQLERLKNAKIVSGRTKKELYAYALASAVQHGEVADVPYWIEKNKDSEMAALAMIDCIALLTSPEPRFRAAKALECMDPDLTERVITAYANNLPNDRRPILALATAAKNKRVTREVEGYRAPLEGLSNSTKSKLLEEFSTYSPYRAFGRRPPNR